MITLQWVGWWNLLAYNIWADSWAVVRDTVYILIGCLLLFVAEKWIPLSSIDYEMALEWAKGVPPTFSIPRKLTNYLKSYIHQLAFLFFWVGAWTVFDEYFTRSFIRDLCYVICPIPFVFISQEILSRESLCWLFLSYERWKKPHSYVYPDDERKVPLDPENAPLPVQDPSIIRFGSS